MNEFGTNTTNCDGHVIEAFTGPATGWISISPKYPTRAEALVAMSFYDFGYELRVYESLVEVQK